MKKLIAMLSSFMMITTASLPIIACHVKEKKFDTNNSITNTHSTVSLFAKEIILADQLKVNLNEIKNKNNNKSLSDLLKENNLTLENTDKSISNINTFENLLNQYFEKDSYKTKNILDSKIELDSKTKKESIPLFSEIFKLFGLGTTDLDKLTNDILKVLDLTTSLNPMFLVSSFDSANDILKSFFKKVEPYLKAGLEKLANPTSEFTTEVEKFQEKIDVNKKYKNLKAEDLDNAFYTTLINAIGLSTWGNRFKEVDLKDSKASESLKETSNSLISAVNGPAGNVSGKELDIVSHILQALQFLQIKLSLFEDSKNYTPKSANNLFDTTKTNQDFIKNLYNSKTIEKIVGQKSSSINLKYLLSFFKKSVDELKDKNNFDGYELQKLLAILFLSPNKVEYPENESTDNTKEYYEKQSAHPIVNILTILGNDFLNQKIKDVLSLVNENIKEDELKKVISESVPHLYKWISYTLTSLLTGTENLNNCLSALFVKVIPIVITSLQKNTKLIPESLKEQIHLLPILLASLIDEVLSVAFPILKSDMKNTNSFKVLYAGEAFLVNKVNEMFEVFREKITKLLTTVKVDTTSIPFDKIKNFLTTFENGYKKVFKNLKQFNLKTLLTTPLNKMNESWWKDKSFTKPLQDKSIVDILDTLLVELNVKGDEKLNELESSNINLTSLTDVAKIIYNYEYKPKGVEYNNKKHLLDILKINSDKTLEILGWTSDKNNPIAKDSLIWTLLTKVFNIDLTKKDDKSENAINQLSKLITSLNNSLNINIIDQSSVEIQFEFINTKKNGFNQLLSETAIAKVKNKNNNSQSKYTFIYQRDKQDKFKFTKITKE
ncbi:MOLPALP family lipoprotein [Mycoplasma capricolum]|uniref:MOLPALP family lipoprotein n=1 Tax=Mycoplasma capricolum TaxID=2095 RepID=UPI0022F39D63|nr:MOLPALP family lipoprotein [Mycoplasma capricolum]WBX35992.1 MOLPALP family lipoprotein [Mycoplasma capricolum subsp. capricolum]